MQNADRWPGCLHVFCIQARFFIYHVTLFPGCGSFSSGPLSRPRPGPRRRAASLLSPRARVQTPTFGGPSIEAWLRARGRAARTAGVARAIATRSASSPSKRMAKARFPAPLPRPAIAGPSETSRAAIPASSHAPSVCCPTCVRRVRSGDADAREWPTRGVLFRWGQPAVPHPGQAAQEGVDRGGTPRASPPPDCPSAGRQRAATRQQRFTLSPDPSGLTHRSTARPAAWHAG